MGRVGARSGDERRRGKVPIAGWASPCSTCRWPPATLRWASLLLLACGLALVAEMLNSTMESLAGHLHPAQHPAVGAAKDIAAAAVLVASLMAIAEGWPFSSTCWVGEGRG